VREDGSGSASAHLVAQVSAVDRRPTDPKFCDAESAGRLRTPLQTSTSTGAQRRGGASWTDYERRTHQVRLVDRRPTDPEFCDAESAGRLRTPLQTSTSTGAQRRGGASWTDYERRTHQVYGASASRWCKCRTLTAIGVDGVRTVERERRLRTVDAARTRGERGFGGGGSCGRRRMTSRALG